MENVERNESGAEETVVEVLNYEKPTVVCLELHNIVAAGASNFVADGGGQRRF